MNTLRNEEIENSTQALGLIGFGAIGREIAKACVDEQIPGYRLAAVLTRTEPADEFPAGTQWFRELTAFLGVGLDIVVEAAGVEAVKDHLRTILRTGPDLVILSVAALADSRFEEQVRKTLASSSGRLYIPSGAIGGLDAVSGAMTGGLSRVVLTQRKPPASLLPPDQASEITSPTVLSEGTAREAALKFPKNANIAAALGIAGPGMDKVIVRVVADPSVDCNTVELEVEGAFGCMRTLMENEASENMRTSRLTGMAVIATLARRVAKLICPA